MASSTSSARSRRRGSASRRRGVQATGGASTRRLDQRQRPLRRVPVGRVQPRGRRRQWRRGRLRPRSAARADASRQHRDRRHVGVGGNEPAPGHQPERPLRRVRFGGGADRRRHNGLRDVFVHDRDLDADGVMDEPRAPSRRGASVSPRLAPRRRAAIRSIRRSRATVATSYRLDGVEPGRRRHQRGQRRLPARSRRRRRRRVRRAGADRDAARQRRRGRQPSSPSRAACRASAPTRSCSSSSSPARTRPRSRAAGR